MVTAISSSHGRARRRTATPTGSSLVASTPPAPVRPWSSRSTPPRWHRSSFQPSLPPREETSSSPGPDSPPAAAMCSRNATRCRRSSTSTATAARRAPHGRLALPPLRLRLPRQHVDRRRGRRQLCSLYPGPDRELHCRIERLQQEARQAASFQVHTYTAGGQGYSSAAADADGDFVVTWTSGHDGDGYGILARRVQFRRRARSRRVPRQHHRHRRTVFPARSRLRRRRLRDLLARRGQTAPTPASARADSTRREWRAGDGFQVNSVHRPPPVAPPGGMDGDGDFVRHLAEQRAGRPRRGHLRASIQLRRCRAGWRVPGRRVDVW